MPPASTSSAERPLSGASRHIAELAPWPPEVANMKLCTVFTSRYPSPNASPEPPNALGMAMAMTKNPNMPSSRKVRREELFGATSLVRNTYPLYIHQIRANISATCPSSAQPG